MLLQDKNQDRNSYHYSSNINHHRYHKNSNSNHKSFPDNRHNINHSQSHKYLCYSNNSLFLICVKVNFKGCYMCENGSTLHHISNKIDIRICMSCECSLRIFIWRSCTCCIGDSVMFLGKTTVVYCHNLHHDGVRDILRNTFSYMHCIQGLKIHLCLSILNIFLTGTFSYWDAI